jgi:hypothetical protein
VRQGEPIAVRQGESIAEFQERTGTIAEFHERTGTIVASRCIDQNQINLYAYKR